MVGRTQEESKKRCASAFADAQRLMRTGRLLEAKDHLVLCGGPRCPQVMHSDCQGLLFTVETSLSTVLFKVDLQGPATLETDPSHDVRIAVDGREPVPFDGKAMALDPGAHDFTFTAHGFQPATRHIVVSDGEMLRREKVTLSPSLVSPRVATPSLAGEMPRREPVSLSASLVSPSAETSKRVLLTPSESVRTSTPQPRSLTVPLIISSSVAVLAGASAVYFGVQARSDDHALDSCAPTSSCSVYATERVRREYLWTNISIGAAVAGLAASTVLYLLDNREPKKANRTSLGFAQRRKRLGAGGW
jgi:hypothetical protein